MYGEVISRLHLYTFYTFFVFAYLVYTIQLTQHPLYPMIGSTDMRIGKDYAKKEGYN